MGIKGLSSQANIVSNFNPLDINSNVFWFDADIGIKKNGVNVSSWQDKNINGNHIAQPTLSRQPFYDDSLVLDSKPFVNFDNSKTQSLFIKNLSSGLTAQPTTYFLVARLKSFINSNTFLFASNVGSRRQSIGDHASYWRIESGVGVITRPVDFNKHIFVGVFDSADSPFNGSRFYLDGGPSTPIVINCGSGVQEGFFLCNQQVQSGGGNYDVWDALMFQDKLSNTEINNVSNFLAAKNNLIWTDI